MYEYGIYNERLGEVKPCPFCGGTNNIDIICIKRKDCDFDAFQAHIKCRSCGGAMWSKERTEERGKVMQDAIDRWNKRCKDVVQCKECKHFNQNKFGNFCYSDKGMAEPTEAGFCSYGERKEKE